MENYSEKPCGALNNAVSTEKCVNVGEKSELSRQHFQQIPNEIINHVARRLLTPRDVIVYHVLLDFQGENDWGWASQQSIGNLTACDSKTVARSLQRLKARGHIKIGGRTKYNTKRIQVLTRIKNSQLLLSGSCAIQPSTVPVAARTIKRKEIKAAAAKRDETTLSLSHAEMAELVTDALEQPTEEITAKNVF